jgi:hypothetical protein
MPEGARILHQSMRQGSNRLSQVSNRINHGHGAARCPTESTAEDAEESEDREAATWNQPDGAQPRRGSFLELNAAGSRIFFELNAAASRIFF